MFDFDIGNDQVFLIQHTISKFVCSSTGTHNIIFQIAENNDRLFSKYVFNDNEYIDSLTLVHDFKIEPDLNPSKIHETVKEKVNKFVRDRGFDGRNELTMEQGIAVFKDMNKLVHELIDDYRAMNWEIETPIFGKQLQKNIQEMVDSHLLF